MSQDFVTRDELQQTIQGLEGRIEASRLVFESRLEAQVQAYVVEARKQMTAFIAEVRQSMARISDEARAGRTDTIDSNAHVVAELRSMRVVLDSTVAAESQHRNQYDRVAQSIARRLDTVEEKVDALRAAQKGADNHA